MNHSAIFRHQTLLAAAIGAALLFGAVSPVDAQRGSARREQREAAKKPVAAAEQYLTETPFAVPCPHPAQGHFITPILERFVAPITVGNRPNRRRRLIARHQPVCHYAKSSDPGSRSAYNSGDSAGKRPCRVVSYG